jgi:hypothetical protein
MAGLLDIAPVGRDAVQSVTVQPSKLRKQSTR